MENIIWMVSENEIHIDWIVLNVKNSRILILILATHIIHFHHMLLKHPFTLFSSLNDFSFYGFSHAFIYVGSRVSVYHWFIALTIVNICRRNKNLNIKVHAKCSTKILPTVLLDLMVNLFFVVSHLSITNFESNVDFNVYEFRSSEIKHW